MTRKKSLPVKRHSSLSETQFPFRVNAVKFGKSPPCAPKMTPKPSPKEDPSELKLPDASVAHETVNSITEMKYNEVKDFFMVNFPDHVVVDCLKQKLSVTEMDPIYKRGLMDGIRVAVLSQLFIEEDQPQDVSFLEQHSQKD